MQSFDDSKSAFWKKNDKNVPGRPVSSAVHLSQMHHDPKLYSPKKEASKPKHRRTTSSSSFQDFQDSTDDAWDVGDDDICIVSDVAIHPKVAHSTAMKVITNHSRGAFGVDSANMTNENNSYHLSEAKAAAMQRLATQKEPLTQMTMPSHTSVHGPGLGVRQIRPSHPLLYPGNNSSPCGVTEREAARLEKFHSLINASSLDLEELRKLSWSGIPQSVRPITWRLLSGYVPANLERREQCLMRKREEYQSFINRYYETRNEDIHQETYRQIHIDVPRMSPAVLLFQQAIVQQAFERVLYIWAIRHPASGYVQGMNDLVTPFYVVFLKEFVPADCNVETYDVTQLSEEALQQVEADSYWCMSQLLDGIQDNYTFAQPGIQKKVHVLKELIQRIDAPLHEHLQKHSVEYLQFSFRWMNNLLMRELPLSCTIRLWDTYLAEREGFSTFHLYVCAAFLTHWSRKLLHEKDFQGLMMTLQNLPTVNWGNEEISLLVAEAYRLKFMFNDAPNHLQPKKK